MIHHKVFQINKIVTLYNHPCYPLNIEKQPKKQSMARLGLVKLKSLTASIYLASLRLQNGGLDGTPLLL